MEFRITRHQMYMEIAHTVAKRATCLRLNVGAVLVHERSIVSIGYNGPPSGEPHCLGSKCSGWKTSCTRSLHAEHNALNRAPAGLTGFDLYVTHSPCASCYDMIWFDRRVKRIFFSTAFRDTSHLGHPLLDCPIYQVLPSGQVINWTTGDLELVKD